MDAIIMHSSKETLYLNVKKKMMVNVFVVLDKV